MATITTVAVIAMAYQNRSVFFSSGETPTREDSVVCFQARYGHQNRSIRADSISAMALLRLVAWIFSLRAFVENTKPYVDALCR